MGTKGKKNTPITARINSGLFNQKKGITEPLLNVGPAGVYGDNQTKDIPSPSKKRGYAKRSPLKQQVGVLESNSTGDQIVKGKKITKAVNTDDYDGSGGFASNEDWTKFLATDAGKEYTKKNTKQVETGGSEPDTVIPGTDSEKFTPTQARDKNDAMSPWRVRQQSRSIKKSGKDVRQSQNKLDKVKRKQQKMIDKYDIADPTTGKKDGKISDKERSAMSTGFLGFGNKQKKFDKLAASFTENTNELDAFEKNMTARTRQVEMSSDPLGKSGTFNSSSRNMELPDASTTFDGQKTIIEGGGTQVAPAVGEKNVSGAFKGKSPMKKRGFGMKKPLYK